MNQQAPSNAFRAQTPSKFLTSKAKIELRPKCEETGFDLVLAEVAVLLGLALLAVYFWIVHQRIDIAIFCITLGGLLTLMFQVAWPEPPALVVINEQGILDRRLGVGVIRWDDIEDVHLEVNGPFICLRVKNPDIYISRIPRALQREKLRFHQSLGFRMLNIGVRDLRVNPFNLRKIIRQRLNQQNF